MDMGNPMMDQNFNVNPNMMIGQNFSNTPAIKKLKNLIKNLNTKMMELNQIIFQINNIFNQMTGIVYNEYLQKMNYLLQKMNSMNNLNLFNMEDGLKGSDNEEKMFFGNKALSEIKHILIKSPFGFRNLHVEYGCTVGRVIKRCRELLEVGPDDKLLNSNYFYFLYNAQILKEDNNEKVEKFFKGTLPRIVIQEWENI